MHIAEAALCIVNLWGRYANINEDTIHALWRVCVNDGWHLHKIRVKECDLSVIRCEPLLRSRQGARVLVDGE